jgi:hypothetical protein
MTGAWPSSFPIKGPADVNEKTVWLQAIPPQELNLLILSRIPGRYKDTDTDTGLSEQMTEN